MDKVAAHVLQSHGYTLVRITTLLPRTGSWVLTPAHTKLQCLEEQKYHWRIGFFSRLLEITSLSFSGRI